MIEQLGATNAPVFVGLIVLSMTLVRLVERLIDNRLTKRNGKKSIAPPAGGCRGLTEEEHAALMRLDDSHAKYDSDGTPLWYVPRSWIKTQKEISKTLDQITQTLSTIAGTQKAIVRTLDRLESETRQGGVSKRLG